MGISAIYNFPLAKEVGFYDYRLKFKPRRFRQQTRFAVACLKLDIQNKPFSARSAGNANRNVEDGRSCIRLDVNAEVFVELNFRPWSGDSPRSLKGLALCHADLGADRPTRGLRNGIYIPTLVDSCRNLNFSFGTGFQSSYRRICRS